METKQFVYKPFWLKLGKKSLDVGVPDNFDDVEQPALHCDEKNKYRKRLYTTYFTFVYPHCVDGYLLIQPYWFATGGFCQVQMVTLQENVNPYIRVGIALIPENTSVIQSIPGLLACSSLAGDQIILVAVGVLMKLLCGLEPVRSIGQPAIIWGMTFRDLVGLISLNPDAMGPIGCYKVIRQWTVLDWCTGIAAGHKPNY